MYIKYIYVCVLDGYGEERRETPGILQSLLANLNQGPTGGCPDDPSVDESLPDELGGTETFGELARMFSG